MKIGNVVVLKIRNGTEVEEYKSKVLEMEKDSFCIDIPQNIRTLKSNTLPKGVTIELTYLTIEGNVFEFNTKVIGKRNTGIHMLELYYPSKENHKKIQRRQFVRVNVPVDIAIHCPNNMFSAFVTHTEDISAGGVAAFVPNNIEVKPEMVIDVWIALLFNSGEFKYIKFPSKIIRVLQREEYSQNIITIEFTDMNKTDRQLLIRYCFEKQLQLRDKLL
ncbi:flagellar brake protein [Bacillus massiliigorillae]|uniref:flagellar brake protein n=1 Tax=Bacillus massiliigorillae TaxID=1243664 RepID=UPI0003A01EB5|nr:PilZ domain-containing protein [Bacillus massiliigorillae]